jgi:hypothetical protein
MKEILKRIHGVMRLLLVASVVLIYPIAQSPPDVIEAGRETLDVLGCIKDYWTSLREELRGSPEVQHYFRGLRSEDSPTYPQERRVIISRIRVSTITNLEARLSYRDLEEPREKFGGVHYDDEYAHKDLESWIQTLKKNIPTLRKVHMESGLGENATFEALAEAVRHKAKLPVVGEYLYIEVAVKVVAIAVVVLLLYLSSLLTALQVTMRSEDHAPVDWVFVHPGILGLVLGVLWLNLPALIVLYATVVGVISLGLGIVLTILLAVGGIAVTYLSLRIRRGAQAKKRASSIREDAI